MKDIQFNLKSDFILKGKTYATYNWKYYVSKDGITFTSMSEDRFLNVLKRLENTKRSENTKYRKKRKIILHKNRLLPDFRDAEALGKSMDWYNYPLTGKYPI